MNDPLKLLRVSYRKQHFSNDNFIDDDDVYYTNSVNLNCVLFHYSIKLAKFESVTWLVLLGQPYFI